MKTSGPSGWISAKTHENIYGNICRNVSYGQLQSPEDHFLASVIGKMCCRKMWGSSVLAVAFLNVNEPNPDFCQLAQKCSVISLNGRIQEKLHLDD